MDLIVFSISGNSSCSYRNQPILSRNGLNAGVMYLYSEDAEKQTTEETSRKDS